MKATINGHDYAIEGLSQMDRHFYLRADLPTVQAIRLATEGMGIVSLVIERSDGSAIDVDGIYQSCQTDLDESRSTGQASFFATSALVPRVL